MARRRAIAVEIATQTRALTCCPLHDQLFVEADADPSAAFALAVELVREQTPYVDEFDNDAHALTDLLTEILAAAPDVCPSCASATGVPVDRCPVPMAESRAADRRAAR